MGDQEADGPTTNSTKKVPPFPSNSHHHLPQYARLYNSNGHRTASTSRVKQNVRTTEAEAVERGLCEAVKKTFFSVDVIVDQKSYIEKIPPYEYEELRFAI